MPKKISIVILGNIHRDPAPLILMRDLLPSLHQKKIPCVHCEEDHADQTLDNKLIGNSKFLEQNEALFKIPAIHNLLTKKKTLTRTYLPLDCRHELEKIIASATLLPKNEVNSLVWSLLHNNAYIEHLKLAQLEKTLGISYCGIEMSLQEQKKMQYETQNNNMYALWENKRIDIMVNNIFAKGCAQLAGDGIIFITCGINHAHRLAVALQLHYNKNPELKNKYGIKIFPLKFFSPYVTDGIESHKAAVAITKQYDSAEVLKSYDLIPCYEIMCTEQGDTFTSAQWNNISIKFINYCQSKLSFQEYVDKAKNYATQNVYNNICTLQQDWCRKTNANNAPVANKKYLQNK
jgi:hypothetical protein